MKRVYDRYGNLILAVLALFVMLMILFAGGEIGLSDNGDFARVMSVNNIVYESGTQIPFSYQGKYKMEFSGGTAVKSVVNLIFSTGRFSEYPSVHHVFVRVSQVMNLLYNLITGSDLRIYRLSFLGILLCVLYSVLLYTFFSQIKTGGLNDFILKLIIIIILCDVGYITYFNSFYSEAIQILALLCVAVTSVTVIRKTRLYVLDCLLFIGALVFYGWSKFANIPAAILGILVFLYPLHKKTGKYAAVISAAGLVILAAVYLSVPKWMNYQTSYNSVFFGVLKDTNETKQYLSDLKLPEYMSELKDSNFYMEEILPVVLNDEFKSDFAGITNGTLLKFYIKNPGYLMEKLSISIKHAGFIRPFYLGNYGKDYERASLSGRFSLWSEIRKKIPFNSIWLNIVFAGIFIYVCAGRCIKEGGVKNAALNGTLPLFIFLGLSGLYSLAVPVISNGEADLAKHMFAYAQLIDFAIIGLMCTGAAEEHRHKPAALRGIISGVLIFAVSVTFTVIPPAIKDAEFTTPGTEIKIGNTVRLQGSGIPFIVTDFDEDSVTLMFPVVIDERRFSNKGEYGLNLWAESEIREWLGGEFLNSQIPDEIRRHIIPTENRYILSRPYKNLADSGTRPIFCFHIPELCARGSRDAYSAVVTDYVFLPSADDIKRLGEAGADLNFGGKPAYISGGAYWLETPYYSNDSMVRVVGKDGYVYMKDANTKNGVLPMIRVKKSAVDDAFLTG